MTTTRRDLIAEEIGADNVSLVEQAYRDGWGDALFYAKRALRSAGASVPHSSEASQSWLAERSTIVGRRNLIRRADTPEVGA